MSSFRNLGGSFRSRPKSPAKPPHGGSASGSFKKLGALGKSFVARSRPQTPSVSIEDAFKVFDKDGSGSLSTDELHAVLTRPGGGVPLTREEVEELIREFDVNQDGELQYEEFAALWASSQGIAPPQPKTSVLSRALSKSKLNSDPVPKAKPVSDRRIVKRLPNPGAPGASPRAQASAPPHKSPHASTRSWGTKPATQPSTAKPKSAAQKAPEVELTGAKDLRALAQDQEEAAQALVSRAGAEGTFERRLGAALVSNELAKKAMKGVPGANLALTDLLRSWDKNKDGTLQKMEFRQAVRTSLKLHATNQDIDALFDQFDVDGSGNLEIQELKPCLKALQETAESAEAEKEHFAEQEAAHRQIANDAREAADAMDAIETEEKRLATLRTDEGAPLPIRMAFMMAKRGKKPEEIATRWVGAIQQGVGVDAKMFVTKKVFREGLLHATVDGSPATPEEADAWFGAVLAMTPAQRNSTSPVPGNESGTPVVTPTVTPTTTPRVAAGKPRRDAPMIELVSTLKRAREDGSRAQEEEIALQKEVKTLQKAARVQQAAIISQLAQRKSSEEAAAEARKKSAAEQIAAAEATNRAQQEARERKQAKKAEEKAAFEAKVEAKRAAFAADSSMHVRT